MEAVGRQRGFTLLELLVVSALTVVVLTMAYTILGTTRSTATSAANRSVNSVGARQALTALEADLRFATAVTICATGTTTTCNAPSATTGATLAVAAPSGLSVATCTWWNLAATSITRAGVATGLYRLVPTDAGGSGQAQLLVPGVSTATNPGGSATLGFSLPLSNGRLVEIDLAVNEATLPAYTAADTVTVHDLISPDDVPTGSGTVTTTGWACT